jgi:S-DNA-T family DNA segregation ATPase FtsK/SpoIIIE
MTVFFFIALLSFDSRDPGWSYSGPATPVDNAFGPLGAFVSDWLLSWFGLTAYVIALAPIQVVRWALRPVEDGRIWVIRLFGVLSLLPALSMLCALHVSMIPDWLPPGTTGGGILGSVLSTALVAELGVTGTALSACLLIIIGLTVTFQLHWPDVTASIGSAVLVTVQTTGRVLRGEAAPAQLDIGARQSLVSRILQPLHRVFLPKRLKQTLTRVAPKPPEPDVAQIEAELLGLRTDSSNPPEMADPSPTEPVAPQVDLSALDDFSPGRREPTWELTDSIESTSPQSDVRIEPHSEAASLFEEASAPSTKTRRANTPCPTSKPSTDGRMQLPDLSLLDPPDAPSDQGFSQDELTAMGDLLIRRLAEFGVESDIVAINPGPVVTRFEIDPAPGVKVSRITNLAKDVARSLAVLSVRVVEVIPGKSTVGIEIPNQHRDMVRLSQILGSDAYTKDPSMLSLALGHDISGQAVCANLAKMPHLLVAGTTGSGKSVGVNAMILSMLYKARPEDLKLILVDPKMLELSIYEGIPHLLAPVVTDMKDAANALRWCVGEMERRYKLMAELGVRNLEGFNAKVTEHMRQGQPLVDPLWVATGFDADETPPNLKTLPYIVVVIDEFADMMMIVGKKVDQLIARLAQKARAAGIHLILATQRPSVDVITGLIKANVPSRISFQVSSKIDSRTVLDQGGAEQLLGHGDMLYLPAGKPVPVRVHGAFVDDHEVHEVVNFWTAQGQPQYEAAILDAQSSDADGQGALLGSDDESDPLYDEAVAFVTETRRASISAVQRKLKIGYNRAARMIEAMESAGVVSEMGTNGVREVLAPSPR